MTRLGVIARREALEIWRQGWNLGVVATLMTVISGCVLASVALLDQIARDEAMRVSFEAWFPAIGLDGATTSGIAGWVIGTANFLLFTQYLGFASVLAGHTILHDRQVHALPFLLLAPVTRLELLLGKVLGAIALPTSLYLAFGLLTMGSVSLFPLSAGHEALLPTSLAWWIAVFVGGPIWALGVGVICATVSAMADDVRGAQQGVWFVMFFATFASGYLLAGRLSDGPVLQGVVAGLGVALTVGALFAGARIVGRELGR